MLSRPRPEQCAADAGLKAWLSTTATRAIKGLEGAPVLFLSDEHCTITLPRTARVRPGDRIELLPSHIDPTINLHDVLYAVEGDEVVEVWPIAARGYRQAGAD